MSSVVRWGNTRAGRVERTGNDRCDDAGRQQDLFATRIGHRLAEVRRARGLTQQQIADHMGVSKSRICQIERGKISGQHVLARYATALGGRLQQTIAFDDGNTAAIA